MAEIAGTVFGIVSLSIQLYDKLSKYTHSVRDAEMKANQITTELDNLVDLLELLDTIVNKQHKTVATSYTHTSINECAAAIHNIRDELGEFPASTGSKFEPKKWIKRLTFPFKEADVIYWKNFLNSVQQSLQIALFALQIDAQQTHVEALQSQISKASLLSATTIRGVLEEQRSLSRAVTVASNTSPWLIESSVPSSTHGSYPLDALGRMQSQNGKLSSYAMTPIYSSQLGKEVIEFQAHVESTRKVLGRTRKMTRSSSICTCRKIGDAKVLSYRPVHLSRTYSYTHSQHCQFWLPENYVAKIQFGLVLCWIALGVKLQIVFALTMRRRSFPLSSSKIICRKIVEETKSPAFKFLASISGGDRSPVQLRAGSNELEVSFRTRNASPHERLSNGQTLLHFLCKRITTFVWTMQPAEVQYFWTMFDHLVSYMESTALEIDDDANTSVDLLLSATDPVDHIWNTLVTHLLEQHELQISMRCHPDETFHSYGSWIEIPFTDYPNPFLCADEATTMMLLRSDRELLAYVNGKESQEQNWLQDCVRWPLEWDGHAVARFCAFRD